MLPKVNYVVNGKVLDKFKREAKPLLKKYPSLKGELETLRLNSDNDLQNLIDEAHNWQNPEDPA